MSVLVRFDRRIAFLRRGEWFSADPHLENELNATTTQWIQQTGGPPFQDTDHERTVAREIAGRFGGRIVKRVRPSPKLTAQIYISRRQLDLDFTGG